MKIVISFLVSIFLFGSLTKDAHAIIVLVPTVLIPIVNIVIWIIAALTMPVLALSTIYFKIKKKSVVLGLLFGIGLLLLLGIIITLVFKLVNPDRSVY